MALASSLLFGVWTLHLRPAGPDAIAPKPVEPAAAIPAPASPDVAANPYGVLPDPSLFAASTPAAPMQSSPLSASFEANRPAPAGETTEPKIVASVSAVEGATTEPGSVAPVPLPEIPQPAESVPLPVPRPADSKLSERRSPPAASGRRVARQTAPSAAPNPLDGIGAFFDNLFGSTSRPSPPALAYASPEGASTGATRRFVPGASATYDQWTAVYDVSAHTVYLPNGTRLEAHSGLGNRMDDPRYVHEPMRGSTPPNVYALRPREELFHGVPALRLIPIGNGDLYGRNGFLAHTYMLGPKGDSNGCVSFRNYDAFLQAYRNGEIKRLVVVASMN